MLSKHGYSPTTVETVGAWLASLYPLKRTSSKRNQLLRLLHMWATVIWHRKSCRLILIDTYSGKAFFYAWTIARIARHFKINYIPILHGGELPLQFAKEPERCKEFIQHAWAVISPSGYLKHEVEVRGWTSTVLIANAIQLEQYTFKKRDKVSPRILWVRSFQKIYNPLMALEVLNQLKSRGYSDVLLCMVGPDKDGSMGDFMSQAKQYGLLDHIEITGRLPKNVWIEKSTNYDIFLNTTNVDNAPVSVVEAMALGLPVVSTNVGGIPFLVANDKDALTVERNDVLAMTEAIIKLIENPQLVEQLVLNARKKAEDFSWSMISEKWIATINSALE